MRRNLFAIVAAVTVVIPVGAAETIDAVWSEHEVEFTFMGLGVAYSCDLVEARIERLLRHLGAADIDVRTSPCPGFDHPMRRLPIAARFSTLALVADGGDGIVKAAWIEVELGKGSPRSIDDRDCELLEQFQKLLLPEFEHDVIEGRAGCDPARRTISGVLKMNVLTPVTADQ